MICKFQSILADKPLFRQVLLLWKGIWLHWTIALLRSWWKLERKVGATLDGRTEEVVKEEEGFRI
jgi:hypothetical protein